MKVVQAVLKQLHQPKTGEYSKYTRPSPQQYTAQLPVDVRSVLKAAAPAVQSLPDCVTVYSHVCVGFERDEGGSGGERRHERQSM